MLTQISLGLLSTLVGMSGLYATLHPRAAGELIQYNPSKPHYFTFSFSRDELSPLSVVGAGSAAGVLNWMAAIAPDTLKSRLQTAPEGKYRGVRDVFFELVSFVPALFTTNCVHFHQLFINSSKRTLISAL